MLILVDEVLVLEGQVLVLIFVLENQSLLKSFFC